MTAWILKKAGELLAALSSDRKLAILERMAHGDNQREINMPWNESSTEKTYVCSVWPRYKIGKQVRFQDGLFHTSDRALQALIESVPEYGAQIRNADSLENQQRKQHKTT